MPNPALKSLSVKTRVPSGMSAREWQAVLGRIRELAAQSARVTNTDLLSRLYDLAGTVVNPQPGDRVNPETGTPVTEGLDLPTARLQLKEFLSSIDYQPDQGEAGTIKDLSSDARINLQLETITQTAQGYGQFERAQDPDVLAAFPCQELYRMEQRDEPRNWPQRWTECAQIARDPKALYSLVVHNRMIARKDSRIWDELGNYGTDGLGHPYPPFAFRSGMWTRDIGLAEAIRLQIIDAAVQVAQQTRGLDELLQLPKGARDWSLIDTLMADLGPDYARGSDNVIRRIA